MQPRPLLTEDRPTQPIKSLRNAILQVVKFRKDNNCCYG